MNNDSSSPLTASSFVARELRISTRIRLHRDFVNNPMDYALARGVDLVDGSSLAAHFKYNTSKGRRVATNQGDIHFLSEGALKIFVEEADGDLWIRNVTVKPSLLLRSLQADQLLPADLTKSSVIVHQQLSPLLADESDYCHLLPGSTDDEPIAYWSRIVTEVQFPGLFIPCFHQLAHPATGPSGGDTEEHISLESDNGKCRIILDALSFGDSRCSKLGLEEGIGVLVTLSGNYLPTVFSSFGDLASVGATERRVRITPLNLVQAFEKTISALSGFYLPRPQAWMERSGIDKRKRVTALMSVVTGVSPDEIVALYENVNPVSEKTRETFSEDLTCELSRLNLIGVAELFSGADYPCLTSPPPELNTRDVT